MGIIYIIGQLVRVGVAYYYPFAVVIQSHSLLARTRESFLTNEAC
jgi:hypothetical protein